jgi:hypothetical protein
MSGSQNSLSQYSYSELEHQQEQSLLLNEEQQQIEGQQGQRPQSKPFPSTKQQPSRQAFDFNIPLDEISIVNQEMDILNSSNASNHSNRSVPAPRPSQLQPSNPNQLDEKKSHSSSSDFAMPPPRPPPTNKQQQSPSAPSSSSSSSSSSRKNNNNNINSSSNNNAPEEIQQQPPNNTVTNVDELWKIYFPYAPPTESDPRVPIVQAIKDFFVTKREAYLDLVRLSFHHYCHSLTLLLRVFLSFRMKFKIMLGSPSISRN